MPEKYNLLKAEPTLLKMPLLIHVFIWRSDKKKKNIGYRILKYMDNKHTFGCSAWVDINAKANTHMYMSVKVDIK